MIFDAVRPFFRTRLKALGFKEHFDAFDLDNIPSTLLDESFFMSSAGVQGSESNHQVHSFSYPMNIVVFKKGFGKPVEARDNAETIAETILSDLIKPSTRLGIVLKDIVPVRYEISSVSESDDKDFVIEFEFLVKLKVVF